MPEGWRNNSPPTSGRADRPPPIAPNVRPHSEHPLVLAAEEQSPAHSRASWAEACALRTRQPALNDVLPSGKYPQERCLEKGGRLLQSVKLGLMMAS